MNHFYERIAELRTAVAEVDAKITNRHGDDRNDRPPTGDDYNELFATVVGWLLGVGNAPLEEPRITQLEKRLRDIAAGARSKADLIASGSPTSAYTKPVDVLRALADEAERGLPPPPMTFPDTRDYLDGVPLVSALWWYIENVNEDSPYRTDLFFYLRERVFNLDPKAEYKFTQELAKREL